MKIYLLGNYGFLNGLYKPDQKTLYDALLGLIKPPAMPVVVTLV